MTARTTVVGGESHSAILTKTGLYVSGRNTNGQLGLGDDTERTTPRRVPLDGVISVSCGRFHTAAVTKDGELFCWGGNSYGELGNGTNSNQIKPQKVALTNV